MAGGQGCAIGRESGRRDGLVTSHGPGKRFAAGHVPEPIPQEKKLAVRRKAESADKGVFEAVQLRARDGVPDEDFPLAIPGCQQFTVPGQRKALQTPPVVEPAQILTGREVARCE